jgi:hypothetical protein
MKKLLAVVFALTVGFGMAGTIQAKSPPKGGSSKSHFSAKAPKAPKAAPGPKIHVRGYTKKDGTHVEPHSRSYPHEKSTTAAPRANSTPKVTTPHVGSSAPKASIPHVGGTTSNKSGSSSSLGVQRDEHGRFKRSQAAKDQFKRLHPCPATGKSSGPCPGYIIDHIVPLCASGPDAAYNMQWQTTEQAKQKDKWERTECRALPRK